MRQIATGFHDRIFLGGVNNGYRSATVVAFDPDHVSGTTDLSLDLPDRMTRVFNPRDGRQVAFVRTGTGNRDLPSSLRADVRCQSKTKREPYNRVIDVTVNKDRIFVTVAESEKEDSG
jgi:hypothetical protein